jgi:mercuric ion transport protein
VVDRADGAKVSTTCELPNARKADGTKRGERWLALSFIFCPCHLPWTLAILAALGGGTAFGAFVKGNAVLVGVVVSALWLAGTAKGFVLIRQAERAAKTAIALDRQDQPVR